MKNPLPLSKLVFLGIGLLMLFGTSSCLPLVAAGGAAAGYIAHGEGYRVQSPVEKTE